MTSFERIYLEVRPIVLRLQRVYHIQLWTRADWDQEGMLVLYLLVKEHPELVGSRQLFVYYKTKMTNYVKDQIRKQESKKRKFNKLAYEEISEIAFSIPSRQLDLEDYVTYKDKMEELRGSLTGEELEKLEALIAGESFKGKAAFIREIKNRFGHEDGM
ncbi:sigma-70 family RNA polymerase sigma factor [Streptococcus caprae]|uniref:Sigma-70 family RNA polymerase sigma factor n=1 Tax=Streptococcus caprae TaxID=1640501 RepID=A0ABV8CU69_9STRE